MSEVSPQDQVIEVSEVASVVDVSETVSVVEVGGGFVGAPLTYQLPSPTGSEGQTGTALAAARADHVHATAMIAESLSLGDLSDVDTSGVASGDVLAFSGMTGDWRPTVVDGGNF